MNIWAFGIIAGFTLIAALAAATLPKLMHAALSFAAMFLGISAFFFYSELSSSVSSKSSSTSAQSQF